jgi:arsenate reductase-like glutaredoxin family protein
MAASEFPEQSLNTVPINDKSQVVLIKASYIDGGAKLNPSQFQCLHWLQANNIESPEIITIFLQHKITLDSMKYLKDTDLIALGVKDWGTRMVILEAINKYFAYVPVYQLDIPNGIALRSPMDQTPSSSTPVGQELTNSTTSIKRKYETKVSDFSVSKKVKTQLTKRMRFKDLDVLVNDPLLPVDIGTGVYCYGSPIRGTVVLNKHKKPVIEYPLRGKKQSATIAQYYKAATGEPLQAKGDSWTKIFFTDHTTNCSRSLEELKYIIKGPKKAVSAFLYFSKEIRGTLAKSPDFAKKSGDMWKQLSDEEKQKYRDKETEDKERFTREKTQWTILQNQLRRQRNIPEIDSYED